MPACEYVLPNGQACGQTGVRKTATSSATWDSVTVSVEGPDGKRVKQVRCREHKPCLNPDCNNLLGTGDVDKKKGKCKLHCIVRTCREERIAGSSFCGVCQHCAVWGCENMRREKIRLCTDHEADHTILHRPPKKVAVHIHLESDTNLSLDDKEWIRRPGRDNCYVYTFTVDREELEEDSVMTPSGSRANSRPTSRGGSLAGSRAGSRRGSIGDDETTPLPSPRAGGKTRLKVAYNTSFARLKDITLQHAKEYGIFGDLRVRAVDNQIEGATQRAHVGKHDSSFYHRFGPWGVNHDHDIGSPLKKPRDSVTDVIREAIRRSALAANLSTEDLSTPQIVNDVLDRGHWWHYHRPLGTATPSTPGTPNHNLSLSGFTSLHGSLHGSPYHSARNSPGPSNSPSPATTPGGTRKKRDRGSLDPSEAKHIEEVMSKSLFTGVVFTFRVITPANEEGKDDGDGPAACQPNPEDVVLVNAFLNRLQRILEDPDHGLPEFVQLSVADDTPTATSPLHIDGETAPAASPATSTASTGDLTVVKQEAGLSRSTGSKASISVGLSASPQTDLLQEDTAIQTAINVVVDKLYNLRIKYGAELAGYVQQCNRADADEIGFDLVVGPLKQAIDSPPAFDPDTLRSEFRTYILRRLLQSAKILLAAQESTAPYYATSRVMTGLLGRSLKHLCDQSRTVCQVMYDRLGEHWFSSQLVHPDLPPVYVGLLNLIRQNTLQVVNPRGMPTIARLLVYDDQEVPAYLGSQVILPNAKVWAMMVADAHDSPQQREQRMAQVIPASQVSPGASFATGGVRDSSLSCRSRIPMALLSGMDPHDPLSRASLPSPGDLALKTEVNEDGLNEFLDAVVQSGGGAVEYWSSRHGLPESQTANVETGFNLYLRDFVSHWRHASFLSLSSVLQLPLSSSIPEEGGTFETADPWVLSGELATDGDHMQYISLANFEQGVAATASTNVTLDMRDVENLSLNEMDLAMMGHMGPSPQP